MSIFRDYSGNILTDPADIDRMLETYADDAQIAEFEAKHEEEQVLCKALKARGLECDLCRPIVCTNATDCICPVCLDIPF